MARTRNKIRYCFEDYMKHIETEARERYLQDFAPLVEIINRTEDDKEIMALAKEYDGLHRTDMFAEAVHLTVYCIACHRMDCTC